MATAPLQVKLRYCNSTRVGSITITIIIQILEMCPSLSPEAHVQKQTHVSIFTLWGLDPWWYSCRSSHRHQAHARLNRWPCQNFFTWVGGWRLVQPEFVIQYVFLSIFSEQATLEASRGTGRAIDKMGDQGGGNGKDGQQSPITLKKKTTQNLGIKNIVSSCFLPINCCLCKNLSHSFLICEMGIIMLLLLISHTFTRIKQI